ncbi:hypothetical protein SAY87_022039 [Trapa incisa]|uniref:Glycine-rich protein n=1 Tax=Trapa incisa TaxID=236973 RepID=A0AAN7PSV0_9MYRT|nr:hypothetical protein SAY87_022039 [Trapa incisa]
MKKLKVASFFYFISIVSLFLLISVPPSLAWTRPDSYPRSSTTKKPNKGGGYGNGIGGFFGSGGGFGIPGLGNGWGGGYGGGFGGPRGGYSKGGIMRPTVVCKEKGPCFRKKLTCPAKCFFSYSHSGKGNGGGGGGGGCTMDCKKKCRAYC